MRVAITGATGLIGGALSESLVADGHTVQRVTRRSSAAGEGDVVWDLERRTIDAAPLEGVDAVVHLAAEPIQTGRLTEERKRRMHDSREVGTTLIAETLAGLDDPPQVLVLASAVGIYGMNRGDEILTEDASLGDDFLAEVKRVLERSAQPAADAGIRVASARTGVIIAEHGPLVEKVRVPFKLGVGGRVGDGRQWIPWISLDDEVRALRFVIESDLAGPVNLCAPEPITNREFTKALGEVLRRPTLLPIPPLLIRAVYGELGQMLAVSSTRALPRRLLDAGFEFVHTDVREPLRAAFDR